MTLNDLGISKSFVLTLGPAAIGGAVWETLGLPLGWLMGAAMVTGAVAMRDVEISVPKPLYNTSLALLGASVGLAITPDVATAIVVWAPVMVIAGALGITGAILMAPHLARWGRMEQSTAFFSLLPGGIIEMANIGDRYGADRTIIAALHAVRVALVVGALPLFLFAFYDTAPVASNNAALLGGVQLAVVLAVGLIGGWLGAKCGMPAAWLLGALLLVGLVSSFGAMSGRIPDSLLAVVQVFVGISLGARFKRDRLASIPRALAVGAPMLLVIMTGMAFAASLASFALLFSVPALILCFSIGGMAEMVLTSKELGQPVALVAAFQAVRGVIVNLSAGAVWRRLNPNSPTSNFPKG